MAERLRRLTRSHMEFSCASSNLADCDTFRSPVLYTSNHQTVWNNEMEVTPWEREKNNRTVKKQWPTRIVRTVEETMTDTHCQDSWRNNDRHRGKWNLRHAVMAEWLGRLTKNQMGSSCASSNLAVRHFSPTSTQHILPSESPKQWNEVILWEEIK